MESGLADSDFPWELTGHVLYNVLMGIPFSINVVITVRLFLKARKRRTDVRVASPNLTVWANDECATDYPCTTLPFSTHVSMAWAK